MSFEFANHRSSPLFNFIIKHPRHQQILGIPVDAIVAIAAVDIM